MKAHRKKLYSASAFALIVSSIVVPAAVAAEPFKDVSKKNVHYEAILSLYQSKMISGFKDGTFKPNQQVTRGQAAKMIATAFEFDLENVKESGFTDITEKAYFYKEINALAELDIISGYEDGTFKPNEPITREHLAKILSLAIGLQTSDETPFTDVDHNNIFSPYIAALYKHGITKGATPTTYKPQSLVSRGELASFIYRSLDVVDYLFDYELSVLHVNDTHGRVESFPKLVTAVENARKSTSNSILLHAGDVFSGTLYFNEFLGQADVKLLNLMNFDAMTLGNHEFDLGVTEGGHGALVDFIKAAQFPIVSANVNFSNDSKFNGLFTDAISNKAKDGHIYSGIVKEVNGEKIGIFGLTTEETKDIAFADKVTFENYIEEANKAVEALEAQGVNKIIAVTHIGYDDNPAVDNDLLLAQNVEGLDIIVGGHSHTQLSEPIIVDKNTVGEAKETTLIVQAYQYADYLGTLDVFFNEDGVITKYNGELIKVADQVANEEALKLLAPFKEKVDEIQGKEIGVSISEPLVNPRISDEGNEKGISVRNSETALGNLITDGMKAKAQKFTSKNVIMALQNGGGIRAAIPAGNVTVGQVITVLPFGNTLALMDVTGAEIKEAFEISVKNAPEENGGFLHVSGAKVVFDSSKDIGSRVVSVEYLNEAGRYEALNDNTTYTIATNAFTAKGGDGYKVFAKAYEEGRVTDLGLSDWENFAEHLKTLQSIPTNTEGRITDKEAK
ncbi:5'-nucleotidase C-terminal domain-containing protein [Lysinibacillus sp. 54212]|uniref:5'-nucleotidase C-terminal domain-containing protein n=1 Tax=Lysinibacillus sp. 54212 TaxID=3119829 RepID=UPI002FC79602